VEEDLKNIPVPVLCRLRKRVSVKEAWERGRSVLDTEPGGHAAGAFKELATVLEGA
jgi:hypothetical protein